MKADLFLQILQQMLHHPHYMQGLFRRKIRLRRRYRWILRHAGGQSGVPMPLVYKFVLTHACNLQCRMCFQWGSYGWCRREKEHRRPQELDWDIVERLFAQVGKTRPDIILSGGEPLLYSRFKQLAALIKKYRCNTIICTNGTQLDRYADVIAQNRFLSFLVSLDGPGETNDFIRGPGVYKRVIENIRALKKLKHTPYIGIQLTIRPENIGQLHVFCKEMAGIGADWILLNLFWFITEEEAAAYERFIKQTYGFSPSKHLGFRMPFDIDKSAFLEQYQKVQEEHLPVQVSCYLPKPQDIGGYIDNAAQLVREKRCYKQWIRADITPRGDVSPCIQFPDLLFGNLRNNTIQEIWNGSQYRSFRKGACLKNHPLCGKCDNIYLYDAKRAYL